MAIHMLNQHRQRKQITSHLRERRCQQGGEGGQLLHVLRTVRQGDDNNHLLASLVLPETQVHGAAARCRETLASYGRRCNGTIL